jgi:hypothetical protein
VEFRQAVAETGPFGRRCLSILPCSPFPLPAHQTGRADFPHPAFPSGFNVTPSAETSSHIQTGPAVPHAILVAEAIGQSQSVSAFPFVALKVRPLRSTVVTRFFAITDLSATRYLPASPSRASG